MLHYKIAAFLLTWTSSKEAQLMR